MPVALIQKLKNRVRGENRTPNANSQPKIDVGRSKVINRLKDSCLSDMFLPPIEINDQEIEKIMQQLKDLFLSRRNWSTLEAADKSIEISGLMIKIYPMYRKTILTKPLTDAIRLCPFLISQSTPKDHFKALTGQNLETFSKNYTEKSPRLIQYFRQISNPPTGLKDILNSPSLQELKVLELLAFHFNEKLNFVIHCNDVIII